MEGQQAGDAGSAGNAQHTHEASHASAQQHQHHEHAAHHPHHAKPKEGFKFNKYTLILIAALIVILIVTIQFRDTLLSTYGFYEPDAFYHFSVIRAAVLHNFVIPKYLSISGWPTHAQVTEPDGLYWVTLFPYAILQYAGITYYSIERYAALVFGILDVLGAYLLSRYFTKDKVFGLLAAAFVALSMGDAARTSATIYRGDSFVTFFLVAALILILEAMRSEGRRRLAFTVASGVVLSICNLVWNGASFVVAIVMAILIITLMYGFLSMKKEFAKKAAYLLLILVVWYLLIQAYLAMGIMTPQTFTDYTFILFLVGFGVSVALVGYLIDNIGVIPILDFMKTAAGRLATAVVYALLLVLIISIISPNLFYNLAFNSGFTINSSFSSTIQELQPPTPEFLFASFGLTIFMTPMSIILYLSSSLTYAPLTIVILFIISVLLMIPYFFLQVKDKEGDERKLLSSDTSLGFQFTMPMAALAAYFMVTAWLQINAVRFNSLISIPLAIFVAYTVFWLLNESRKLNRYAILIGIVALIIIIAVTYGYDIQYSAGIIQADNINPQFISALMWLKANSPNNSVVLTLWPDGSVVEGVANRTSITDSVGAQWSNKSDAFAQWIFNSSPDGQFLTSNMTGRPNYLLVRFPWLTETQGIFTEAGLNNSLAQSFGYLPFSEISMQQNATTTVIDLAAPSEGIESKTVLTNTTNGSRSESSFLELSNGDISPYSYVAFFDQDNGQYSLIQQTAFNQTNDQMLIITYSGVPRPQVNLNVTGGYIVDSGIGNSNMLKFLFLCSSTECAWNDSSIATIQQVYINQDTKIFQITYNTTS